MRKLLAVDDNRLILRVIEDFFVPHAWDVTACDDARVALDSLARQVPDAIVSDILMPGMDGWDLFDEVKKRPEGAEIPFVFLTVEGELPQRLRGLHLGADEYMTKPFAVEELHARVERLVERRQALDTARRGGDALLAGSVEHLAIFGLYFLSGAAYLMLAVLAGMRWRLGEPYPALTMFGWAGALFCFTATDIYGSGGLFRLHALAETMLFPTTLHLALVCPTNPLKLLDSTTSVLPSQ